MILSVIIVTFNSENHIGASLTSLPWEGVLMEAWVIDNQSSDRTRERIEAFHRIHPKRTVHKIWNPSNRGYASAVNQGLRMCRGEFYLLLGPDVKVFPGSIESMMDFLKTHPDVGIVAPQLLRPDGGIQPSCRRFPTYADALTELSGLPRLFPSRCTPAWKMPDFNHMSQREVNQPEATAIMTRRQALRDVGPMDERFSMFFNDVDWCRRFIAKGWKIVFYSDARVEHDRGASVLAHPIPMIWKSHQGFYRYFRKYNTAIWQTWVNQAVGLLLILTATFRTLARLIKYR
jgi:N-acetylglucosaminyl-diphospho-decaprenol L-rhamnosyltransferase